MNGVIIMKEKDLEKIKIMQLLLQKQVTQEVAAKRLNISEHQVRNIFKKCKELGDKGVISKKNWKIKQPSINQKSLN